MEKTFTISAFTENRTGILNRITIIFNRRRLSIDSITVSKTEMSGVFRYTIVLKATREQINRVIGQIEKLVEILKAFAHDESEVIHQEIALYKLKTNSITNDEVEKVIRENHARILSVDPHFMVIEKTGHVWETQLLFEYLKPFGILEFACSGRVAVTKPMKELNTYLMELEQLN
jgi:acetolactate synthase-1/3 small subunit